MKGKLIAIEGADGSGKATQAKLLLARLRKKGKKAVLVSFPRYNTFFGKLVKKYLQGKFGSLQRVKPELSALLYSLDRYDAIPEINKWLARGKIVLCDRYIASNIAHQAAKLKGKEQHEFIEWLSAVESRLPKPDLTIFLDLPVAISAKLMRKEGRKKDIHEADLQYLEATRRVFTSLCKKPNWVKIDCSSKRNGIKTRQEIHEMIWKKVREKI